MKTHTFPGIKQLGVLAVALLSLLVIGCQSTGHARAQKMDIVETAMAAGDFDTLVTAVKAAGLVETLKGDGPFTVFAPTDEAFAKIPSDQLNALIADKEALAKVLTYHVVAGKVMASDVVNLSSAKSVQGQSISIDTSNGVKVDNANVIKTDILTSNGVIHVIDSVILPM
nr:fasciclin domain-containing protein [Solemya velesiana gill symbiont]